MLYRHAEFLLTEINVYNFVETCSALECTYTRI